MTTAVEITVGTAILLALWKYFAHSMIPSSHLFWNAMTTSVWVGIVLGDIPTAVTLGAAFEMIFVGSAGFVGGVSLQDECVAALIAIPAIMTTGLDTNAAVALVIPIGLVFAQINNLGEVLNSIANRIAEYFVKKHKFNGVYFAAYGMPWIIRFFLTLVPLSIMIYLGSAASSALAEMIPTWLSNGLSAVGSAMPAVGFGIILYVMGNLTLIPFALAGFFIVQYAGISTMSATLLGAFLAFLYWLFAVRDKNAEVEESAQEVEAEEKIGHLLTKKDVSKTRRLWWLFSIACESWEYKQGLDFAAAMLPCLKKLYKDDPDELEKAVTREMQFFNTESQWGACCPGVALALEEAKAAGAPVTDEAIISTKTGLMGPFAGIGDSLSWGLVYFLVIGLCLPGAAAGNAFAAVLPPILFGIYSYVVNRFMFYTGYNVGVKSAASLMQNGKFTSLITVLTVLGMFMVGALAASYVTVSTPITITLTTGSLAIQDTLDGIIPGLLPLGTVALSYFITKRTKNFLVTALSILALGVVLGCLGIIA